ncbi:DUF4124 domain-containing protein [Teredinibacter sp. KSP-S5-2]|uniref:DUF4124 domain-containing protein n=1 Tax=Teredinibacter sp. KSP-S5-2 TaxID=3034506 RepID=UPI0029343EA4|nr:DUF4124 domain-containing protein [Teredinibacter sp. KSP-S5-2]WNO11041.1 DUF4124 domain-containing protein [Teredinibacter sp. KSP-S5-2]
MEIRSLLCACLITIPLTSQAGEIYTWKDENGKVHFGDRQQHKEAQKVEQTETNSSEAVEFRPPLYNTVTTKPAQPVEQNELVEICKKAAEDYRKLSSSEFKEGVRHVLVLETDDGKMLTRREQNRLAEEFRKRHNAMGCDIKQAEKLKL